MTEDTLRLPPVAEGKGVPAPRRIKFIGANDFQAELRRRVDEFFLRTGKKRRDCTKMYVKTAILLCTTALLYVLLVFVATTWWVGLPLAILTGLAAAAIGFNVQHDGGHEAYSNHPWVNKCAAMTLDLIGGSSYLWRWKHVIFHHTYTNITDVDTDVDLGILGRLTPHQKHLWFHRWQHYYLWPLYGFIAIKWQMFDDYKDVVVGRIGQHRVARPKGWDLVVLCTGKALFLTLVLVIPCIYHRFWVVILFYGVASVVMGMFLSIVFQLAHCVQGAEFPLPVLNTDRIDNAWAVHEAESTVDFSRRSRVAAWLLGGLNFQIEHHLCPRICHIHYPAISKIVEQTCHDLGVRYMEHRTFWSGIISHYRFLREMGLPNPPMPAGTAV
jgi:linoleoyl-CoA desaturase